MTTYKMSLGADVVTVDLVAIAPQPRSEGVKYVRRTFAASGIVSDQSAYVELIWEVLESATEYNTLLTQFGLNASIATVVTVLVRDEFFNFTRYNGLAIRPQPGTDKSWDYFPRNVTILIKNLEQLVEA